MLHAEFRDPLLVAVYDAECPWTREDDFFLGVVGEAPKGRVLDLGCGTGRLALGLAAAGHVVTGVDPAGASLQAARAKPGSERVTWVEGTSADLPVAAFDIAVMTSHVAQFFVTDEEFGRVLADLKRALVPGGRLVFDTRDPAARRWEAWNPVDSHRQVELADGTVVTAWTEVTAVIDGAVSFTHHYTFSDHQQLQSTATLRFRTEREVRAALHTAGFQVGHVYGGWNREPVGDGDGELLVIAHR
ncbi:class I SAM-dependent methyltransferase [Streptomyces sp. NPDC127092]|uniref:class I SAM-dependent methyltransferase n=1 Tax=Streptomyces sp. NPDC127092 TaxID=3347135 RepID=UPI0036614912